MKNFNYQFKKNHKGIILLKLKRKNLKLLMNLRETIWKNCMISFLIKVNMQYRNKYYKLNGLKYTPNFKNKKVKEIQ